MAKDSRETLGIGGSQDYDSAIGWEPVHMRERTARKLSEKVAADTLYCQPMNKWMQSIRAVTAEDGLFGPFWLRNELAIMFSAAGVGKSLLATQIAEHVARGFLMEPFAIDAEICRPERVLYLDFELNREQLVSRYSVTDASGTAGNHLYSFSSDIIRSEHFWNGHLAQGYESFTEMLFDEVT
ncbi:MAG: AAA family ATPase, partial [Pyrinomonadaceae bacterium]